MLEKSELFSVQSKTEEVLRIPRTRERTGNMSKYDSLWNYISCCQKPSLKLTFDEIREIAGIPIDHSFLRYQKELLEYGYQVKKISMKGETVLFVKTSD